MYSISKKYEETKSLIQEKILGDILFEIILTGLLQHCYYFILSTCTHTVQPCLRTTPSITCYQLSHANETNQDADSTNQMSAYQLALI